MTLVQPLLVWLADHLLNERVIVPFAELVTMISGCSENMNSGSNAIAV